MGKKTLFLFLVLFSMTGCLENKLDIFSSPGPTSGNTVHVGWGTQENPQGDATVESPVAPEVKVEASPLPPPVTLQETKVEVIPRIDPDFPVSIEGSEEIEDYKWKFSAALREAAERYETLPESEASQCRIPKNSLFAANNNLRIRIAIGYQDFSPQNHVSDLLERQLLQDFLQERCIGNFPLCEFELTYEGGFRSVLEKQIGDRKIILTITTSSISTNNQTNEKEESQIEKSDYAVSQFLSSFRVEDVVVYWGHGRSGGGPDFHPPELTKKGDVNYSSYENKKAGRSLLQAGLGLKGVRTQFVGMFGCNTTSFTKPLAKIFPHVNFSGSVGSIDGYEMARGGLTFIAGIINNDCRKTAINKLALDEIGPRSKEEVFVTEGPAYKTAAVKKTAPKVKSKPKSN